MTLTGDDLAYATLDRIRERPAEWDQTVWFCGTTACFAGTAARIMDEDLPVVMSATRLDSVLMGDTETVVPAEIEEARKALGWTVPQAWHVFWLTTSDFSDLEKAVKDVLNGDIE